MSKVEMMLTLIPKVSEKTFAQSESTNTYAFRVPTWANKEQIKHEVEKQYKVNVIKVNSTVMKGKKVTSYRKGGRPIHGKRNDFKKAYVTLAKDNSITLFEESN